LLRKWEVNMPLPLIAMGIGAAVGAGVGSMGKDHWGWGDDAIWQGAALGATAGYGVGAAGPTATGTGAKVGGAGLANAATTPSRAMLGASLDATLKGAGGANWGNALMLGQAGLGLAQAFSSQGQAPSQKIKLSKQGEAFQKETLLPAVKEQYARAISGNVSDKAFGAISTAKTQESVRQRGSQSILAKAQAEMGNRKDIDRGGAAMGGGMVKALIADAGERMSGLFAPTSILNNFRKQELMNSVNQIQNVQNRENVVGQFNYSGNLAAWNANQAASAQKGAALGQVAQMYGSYKYNTAMVDQYKKAMA
jgi:hypothetical protein